MNWESLSTNEHRAGWTPTEMKPSPPSRLLGWGENLEQLQRLGALEHMLTGFYGWFVMILMKPAGNITPAITLGKGRRETIEASRVMSSRKVSRPG
jgi:hypothetical protein